MYVGNICAYMSWFEGSEASLWAVCGESATCWNSQFLYRMWFSVSPLYTLHLCHDFNVLIAVYVGCVLHVHLRRCHKMGDESEIMQNILTSGFHGGLKHNIWPGLTVSWGRDCIGIWNGSFVWQFGQSCWSKVLTVFWLSASAWTAWEVGLCSWGWQSADFVCSNSETAGDLN